MTTKIVYKTVAFYELRDEDEGKLDPVDWQEVLRELHAEGRADPIHLRHEFNDARHYARVYPYLEEDHLVLAKARDEPPSTLDESTGDIFDEQVIANRPWVEVSVIHFFPGTNLFGFVLGTMASPRAGAVADWFNQHELFEDALTVVPHVSDSLIERLRDGSAEARLVSLELSSEQLANQVSTAGLYTAAQQLGRDLDLGPEVDVEVSLRVRGRSDGVSEGTKRDLADRGRELIDREMVAGAVELIDATDGHTNRELVDLIKHKMTTKQKVSVMDDDGRQVRIPSALNAITKAARELNIATA